MTFEIHICSCFFTVVTLFQIPNNVESGQYKLAVNGTISRQLAVHGVMSVGVAARGPTVLVQTDKPVYKPGQTGVF